MQVYRILTKTHVFRECIKVRRDRVPVSSAMLESIQILKVLSHVPTVGLGT